MKVSFQTKKLQKLCEDEREMHKRRPDIERKLRLRIAALKANNTIAELEVNDPLGKWHRLKENRKGQWSGAVSSNERIIIEPLKNGVRIIDIEKERRSTEARVVEIIDYHEE